MITLIILTQRPAIAHRPELILCGKELAFMDMNIGKIITGLRDKKGWSQAQLTDKSGVSRVMVGKYERGEAMPSIDAAKKIADVLEVSLEYLAGNSNKAAVDKKNMKLIHDIEDLEPSIKDKQIFLANVIIRDAKTGKAYAH